MPAFLPEEVEMLFAERFNAGDLKGAADLALLRSSWKLAGKSPGGEDLKLEGRSIEIVRHQSDGSWRFVINHPYAATP